MFFEVERLSGGGPIETLVFMTDKGKVVITYKEPGGMLFYSFNK